jgi:transposase-like protein
LVKKAKDLEGASMPGEGFIVRGADKLCLDIVYKVYSGQLTRKEGKALLNISSSTLKRYLRDFRKEGIGFILHGNRGRAPKNRISPELKRDVQELVRERYFDFNVLHIQEKLSEHQIAVKRETLRKWCHEIKMVKRSKRRRGRPHYRRTRMSQAGLMVMIDGSHHRWFADVECCLNLALDDATSEILFAEFSYGETTAACLKVLRRVVERHGSFKVLYTDRAGVFGGIKRSGFSQVERALGELGTEVIYAQSPEAKGRIERLFQTLQDRLVAEMRLKGIKSMDEANRFLQEEYIPHAHNPRFTVAANNPKPAFVKLHATVDLESIFCVKEYRVVARDHTISFGADTYLIVDRLKYSIHKQRLEIRIAEGGKWQAFFAGKPLKLGKITKVKLLAG